MNRVLRMSALLLVVAWLEPLHVLPWPSWHSEVPAFLAAMLIWVSVLLKVRSGSERLLHVPYSSLLWIILLMVVVFQWAIGLIPFYGDAGVLAMYFMLAFAVMTSGFQVGRFGGYDAIASSLNILAWCILTGAFLSTSVALVQAADVWTDLDWIVRNGSPRRPGGNLGQPNQLGTLLLMGMASLLFLYSEQRLRRPSALMFYLVLIFGLGLTESRTGLLGAAVLLGFWLSKRKQIFPAVPKWLVFAGFTLLILVFLGFPALISIMQEGGKAAGPTPVANFNVGTRLVVWPQLLEAAQLRPWLGWGLRQLSAAHNEVLHKYLIAEPFTYAHNIVLDLVLCLGFPTGIVLVFILILWTMRSLARVENLYCWYGWALFLPLAVHSMFEYPFAYAYFLVPVLFGLGVVESLMTYRCHVRFPMKWLALPSIFFVLTMGWSTLDYIAVEEDFRIVRFEAQRAGETPPEYKRPNIYFLSQMAAMLEVSRLQPTLNMGASQLELMRQVALRFPWTALQNRYALALALNGNPNEALRQLNVMRAMHGERHYQSIRDVWMELANSRYPQLKALNLP
ncbi:PglL family O-oligosaccharyltransferase [Rhodoferax mekongensis]|uniref:PglL family O-oligosaccharyltransferase n=1 Tax=Rhodoferax mekongensis TaxID=3068341 RepID=UPI0028BEA4A0|nr:Wzy polymerase domain-containing protein [Rhodoferax sp. TBRC 17199]MDT7513579.1 Wzy polymerase domain-containing protein [Rhodoferax sp. TBRC 17199]